MWKLLILTWLVVGCKKEEPRIEKLPAEFKAEAEKIGQALADEAKKGAAKAKDLADEGKQDVVKAGDKLKDLAGEVADDVKEAAGDKDARCSNGRCTQTCAAGKTCSFSCSGGHCTQTCENGATCDLSCSGGSCMQKCDGPCKKSCTGTGCS